MARKRKRKRRADPWPVPVRVGHTLVAVVDVTPCPGGWHFTRRPMGLDDLDPLDGSRERAADDLRKKWPGGRIGHECAYRILFSDGDDA